MATLRDFIRVLFRSKAIAERLGTSMISGRLLLPPDQGRVRSMLYQQHAVAAETHRDDGASELDVRLPHHDWMRILSAGDLSPDQIGRAASRAGRRRWVRR